MAGKLYFPNLTGLRFFAALMVLISHIEQFKSILSLPNYWEVKMLPLIGKLGVTIFFVLSGFLITFILLKELSESGSIAIKKFYIKRILRIWPLYYLILLLSFFVLPYFEIYNIGNLSSEMYFHIEIKILLAILFLPNLLLTLFPAIPYFSQAWSLGVEEQFYLIWPILLKKVKNKIAIFITILLLFVIVKLFVLIFFSDNSYFNKMNFLIEHFNISGMAIGGFFAYLLFKESSILKILFNVYIQIATYLAVILLILNNIRIPLINYELYGLLFGVIILNLAANRRTILSLENRVWKYLGKISYGIYMYHSIAIVSMIKIYIYAGLDNLMILSLLCTIFTIILAAISYRFYEKYFIDMKSKY